MGRRGLTVLEPLGLPADERANGHDALTANLEPTIHGVYPLADAARAHEDLERRRNVGAVLLAT